MNRPPRALIRDRKSAVKAWLGCGSRLARAFLTLPFLLLLPGCFRHEPPADVTIVNGAEPESLDPAIVTGVPEMRIVKALFDGLTRLDAHNARPVPALAERWEISEDG